MRFVKIDLEDLVRRIGWSGKHADYICIAGDVVVVVEETERAKIDDVDKLDSTVQAIKEGLLSSVVPSLSRFTKLMAVVHARRGIDPMVQRCIRSRTRRGIIYCSVSCDQHLETVLREYIKGARP